MGPEGDSWIWYNYFPEACIPQGPRAGMLSCRSGSSSPGSPSAPTDPSPHESAAAPCRATLPPLPIPQAPLPCAKPGKMMPWPPADQRPAPSTQHPAPRTQHPRGAGGGWRTDGGPLPAPPCWAPGPPLSNHSPCPLHLHRGPRPPWVPEVPPRLLTPLTWGGLGCTQPHGSASLFSPSTLPGPPLLNWPFIKAT